MVSFNRLSSLTKDHLDGKKVILRTDLNLPMTNGKVSNKSRLTETIPTINYLINAGASVIIISHFGRPKKSYEEEFSLKQILECVSEELGRDVQFFADVLHAGERCRSLKSGDILMLENIRFYKQEEDNDHEFAKKLASYADYYVNDAFACSHRNHASISAITEYIPSFGGILLEKEVDNVEKILKSSDDMFFLVGGSKVSTKLLLLKNLVKNAKFLAVGGGMANTFLHTLGYNVGMSLCEPSLKNEVMEILSLARNVGCEIVLPTDVIVCKKRLNTNECFVKNIEDISDDDVILDIGVETVKLIEQCAISSKNIIWNGPFGVFEQRPFNVGTESVARTLARLTKYNGLNTIVGGGDVVSAVSSSGLLSSFSYVSTGGGAFLEYIENGTLPGVEALKKTKA